MAFTAKLELRQSHSLVMTPQLQQAIKLLQLSNMELTAFVEAELERNPLLEREESDDTGGAQGEASQAEANLFGDAKQEANGNAGDSSDAGEGETSGGDDGVKVGGWHGRLLTGTRTEHVTSASRSPRSGRVPG